MSSSTLRYLDIHLVMHDDVFINMELQRIYDQHACPSFKSRICSLHWMDRKDVRDDHHVAVEQPPTFDRLS